MKSPAEDKEKDVTDEKTDPDDALQGTWKLSLVEWSERNSTQMAFLTSKHHLIVKGNEAIKRIEIDGKVTETKYAFVLDQGKRPKVYKKKAIDGKNKGQTETGIYSVEGDTLRICHKERGLPTDFDIRQGVEVNDKYLYTYYREKPEAKEPGKPATANGSDNIKDAGESWQRDFDQFAESLSKSLASLAKMLKDKDELPALDALDPQYNGKAVQWTLTYKGIKENKDAVEIEFDGVRRKVSSRFTYPLAKFAPAEGTLEQWKAIKPGTRVSFKGKIVKTSAFKGGDTFTGESFLTGNVTVVVEQPLEQEKK